MDCVDLVGIAAKETKDSSVYNTIMASMRAVRAVMNTEHVTDDEDTLTQQQTMVDGGSWW